MRRERMSQRPLGRVFSVPWRCRAGHTPVADSCPARTSRRRCTARAAYNAEPSGRFHENSLSARAAKLPAHRVQHPFLFRNKQVPGRQAATNAPCKRVARDEKPRFASSWRRLISAAVVVTVAAFMTPFPWFRGKLSASWCTACRDRPATWPISSSVASVDQVGTNAVERNGRPHAALVER